MTGRGWRLPIRPFGVPVELDPSFALVLPLFAWLIASQVAGFAALFEQLGVSLDPAPLSAGAAPWILGVTAALGLFTSVLIHELGHAVTARLYGVKTNRITLWFLGGVAQLDDMPRSRGAEAIVAIAGPITSALLSLLLWGVLRADAVSGGAAFVVAYVALTNAGLALFNLLPALPLDGGRVLRSLLALWLGDARATRVAGGGSRAVAIALGVYGFLTLQVFLLAIAFFVDAAGRAEVVASQARRAFEGRRVREAMTRDPVSIDLGWSVLQLRKLRAFRPHAAYPVLDLDGAPIGWVRTRDLDGADEDTPLPDLLVPIETVAENDDLEAAVRRLATSEVGRLLVLDDVGRAVGMLAKTDVVRFLQRGDPSSTHPA
jgi:Zn-dependent protease/CBS domain-containing protein